MRIKTFTYTYIFTISLFGLIFLWVTVWETEEHLVPCSFSARLFTKLVLEAPVITESALEVIRRYCEDEVSKKLPVHSADQTHIKNNLSFRGKGHFSSLN